MGIRGMLEAGIEVSRLSHIYETEPVETFAQPHYLNMVAELKANPLIKPEEMMTVLLNVEQSLGRTRDSLKGPRTIDLDLLFYGNQTRANRLLSLPHPRLQERRFVLVPLAELCPNLRHPVLEQTIKELLQKSTDRSEVKLWKPELSSTANNR